MAGTEEVVTAVSGTAANIWLILIWVLLIAVVISLIIAVFWIRSYSKKRIVLYEKLSNGWQQKTYNAKEYRGKDGGLRWKIWKVWRKTPRPPSHSIIMDDKKKLVAYGFIVDDNIVWADTKLNFSKESLSTIKFDPLLAEDKNMYINEVEESEKYRRKRFIDVLGQAAPVIGIIIILVVFMAFFGQVVEPMNRIGNQIIDYDKQNKEQTQLMLDKVDAILNDKQTIGSEGNEIETNIKEDEKPPN